MSSIHKPHLLASLVKRGQTIYRNFNLTFDLMNGSTSSIPERHLKDSAKPSKLQYELPTELLQAIFLELHTIDDARAAIATCRTMHNAFEGYKKKIIWTILCREIEAKLPGTCDVEFMLPPAFGGLAIFVSPREAKDELLDRELRLFARPRAPMLGEHGDLVWRLVTLGMATDMVGWYRNFVEKMPCDPSREFSACVRSMVAAEDWDPRNAYPECDCAHCAGRLFQPHGSRFRLRSRMVLNYKPPGETPRETPVETPRPLASWVEFRCRGGVTSYIEFR